MDMSNVRHMTTLTGIALTLLLAPAAQAAITIGDPGSPAGIAILCPGPSSNFQISVNSGPDYRVPPDGGVITSWSTLAGLAPADHAAALLLADRLGNGPRVIRRDPTQPLTGSALNTFPVRIPVVGGEYIGLLVPTGSNATCQYGLSATAFNIPLQRLAEPTLNTPELYTQTSSRKVAVSAVVERDDDKDGFGDDTQDSCPIDASVQVPCLAEINSGPPKKTKSKKATFAFEVDSGKNISFQCAIDKKAFAACSSPASFKKLKPRKHKFQVRGVDAGGQVGTPAQYRWRVTG
jgi:hypothetical protein